MVVLPIIKVFDVDYSFIIKNYLDPKMWQKEWTLFLLEEYEEFKEYIKTEEYKEEMVDGLEDL